MKKFYILLSALLVSAIGMAQYQMTSPEQLGAKKVLKVPSRIHHQTQSDRGTYTFTHDYSSLDDQMWGNIFANNDAYGWDIGSTGVLDYGIVMLDTLVDVQTLTGIDTSTLVDYTIDSLYVAMGHYMTSGQTNYLIVRLVDIGTNEYPDLSDNELWRDSVVADSNLWGQTSWLQFFYVPFTPNITVSKTTKLAVIYEYQGATGDTAALMAWWLNDGACGTLGYDRSTDSYFAPNSFAYWNQFSAQLPDQSGGDVYYDCNQNSSYDAGVDGESFVQDIDMVFVITAKTTVGMEERSMNSVVSIYPNPSDGQFTLDFSKLAGGDVAFAVRDVLGELVYAEKEDISGFNKKQMDLSFLKTGVYFLTISNTDMQGTFKITIK